MTAARARVIYQRQRPYRFGSNYQAATRATREEAPRGSRPSQLKSRRLDRTLHLLSIPERKAVQLALYNPDVIEIYDQFVLWPGPYLHPLAVLDSTRAAKYPGFQGTVDVADRLGYLKHHPTFTFDKDGKKTRSPWPLQGDILLFKKRDTEYRCVNWSVKKTPADFLEPDAGSENKESRQREKKRARFEIETLYCLDAGIRTQPVTEKEIDPVVAANLHKLCLYSTIENALSASQAVDLLTAFQLGLETGNPPSVTIARLVATGRYDREQARIYFYHAIWNRELRVDLHFPLRIDLPAHPERSDILVIYAAWFAS